MQLPFCSLWLSLPFSILLSAGRPAFAGDPDPAQIEDLYAHSLQIMEEARRVLAGNSRPLFLLAEVHKRFGFDARALDAYAAALAVEPNHPEAHHEMGAILSNLAKMEEARSHYRQVLKLAPRFPGARTRLGLIEFHEGRLDAAAKEYQEEISNRTPTAFTYSLLGHALKDLKRFDEAIGSYREAIRLDPVGDPQAHYGLAQAYELRGLSEEAERARAGFVRVKAKEVEAARKGLVKETNRPDQLRWTAQAYFDAGEAYLQARRNAEAETSLRRAVLFDPALNRARALLIDLLRRSQRIDEAFGLAQEMVSGHRSPATLFTLAGLSTERRAFDSARGLLEEVIRLDPNDSDAPRELARLLLGGNVPPDPARALALAKRAVQLAPSGSNYSVLSWACYLTGDQDGAILAIETASRLEPQNRGYREQWSELMKRKKP